MPRPPAWPIGSFYNALNVSVLVDFFRTALLPTFGVILSPLLPDDIADLLVALPIGALVERITRPPGRSSPIAPVRPPGPGGRAGPAGDGAHPRHAGRASRRPLVEVEAYQGPGGPGRLPVARLDPRNAVMFGAPGHLYVYLIYGAAPVRQRVRGPGAKPEAVLLRAAEITCWPRPGAPSPAAPCRTSAGGRPGQPGLLPLAWTGPWMAPISSPD